MAQRRRVVSTSKREPFPWLLFLVLALSVWFFWFSPLQRKPAPVKVNFAPPAKAS